VGTRGAARRHTGLGAFVCCRLSVFIYLLGLCLRTFKGLSLQPDGTLGPPDPLCPH